MEPLYRLAQGSTSIEIYGGYREIGGNCVVIRDGDRKLVLDNGIRFSILRKYYRGGLQPLGPHGLQRCPTGRGWRSQRLGRAPGTI